MALTMRSRTAVVIDDSDLVLELVEEVLGAAGWTCVTAMDGLSGLAAIAEHNPDVVLCDLHMPGFNGMAVLQNLKRRGYRTPVVILSLDDDLAAVRKAIAAGAYDYVIKTGDEEAILQAAERAARHHESSRAAAQRSPLPPA